MPPRLLFIPVSGPYGMGEYARSLAIARAASERWPAAEIRFMLSAKAPYAAAAPFSATLLPSSPTFHSAQVIEQLQQFRPHVVIFDNAGRTAQLRAAQRVTSRIVYISARARQRGKAFRWSWMRMIDEHWIAYPRFIAGALNPLERLKLRLLRRPTVRYLDVIVSRDAPAVLESQAGGTAESYVLLVPGGGTGHPGARDAVAQFLSAARMLAMSGVQTLFVGSAADEGSVATPVEGLRCLTPLPQSQLMTLMRHARLVIANGGSTLLQGIACGCACVAVPIAGDQKQRIEACVAAGVARSSSLRAADIMASAQALLGDETQRVALARRAAQLRLADGVEIAMTALDGLLRTG
jgi:ADP-heptose:LPS heptosyltransferase